ncbi:MAG TPA: F0F1 ATP synthase subunit B [Candidatus Limnocylindrales bacterium]|nr:F0F1 ATP synthase subunit B [Candidatus Limnocylindrales bacterium]
MDALAIAREVAEVAARLAQEEGAEAGGLTINLFWIVVSALNFLVFLVLIWAFAFRPISAMLEDRRARIEQGLRDAEHARRERERAEVERQAALAEARREANEIIARAQKVAQELREADLAATREEVERMRSRAVAEIEAEKERAMADLRTQVADLAIAAASKILGEAMTEERQRRLVEEFLAEATVAAAAGSSDGSKP